MTCWLCVTGVFTRRRKNRTSSHHLEARTTVRKGSKYCVQSESFGPHVPEQSQGGLTHAFVVGFASLEDRDYYVFHDPAHQAFIKSIEDKVDDVKVLDYEKGVF